MPRLPDTPLNRQHAAMLLRGGGVVAYPTDTLYGLGSLIWDESAVDRVYQIKGRGGSQGLPVLLSTPAQLDEVALDVSDQALALGARFWPGALTFIVRRSPKVSAVVAGGLNTLAVRVPAHPTPRALIEEAGGPITGTSANLHGGAQPVTAQEVERQLGEAPAMILDGGPCEAAVPSTILDLTGSPARLLRHGALSIEVLRQICEVTDP